MERGNIFMHWQALSQAYRQSDAVLFIQNLKILAYIMPYHDEDDNYASSDK